jgi:IPT/TIG domain
MAQSAITVTVPNPTPPTNMSFVGQSPPNAPTQAVVDDGTAGTLTVFATKTASADNANFPSVDHEGKGTEVTVVAPGSQAYAPTISFSDLGNYTTNPNRDHASSLSPATAPEFLSISPTTAVKGTSGTTTITATGTGFVPGCRIWANNVEQTTTFVSATSLTAAVKKSPDAGVWPIEVKLGGTPIKTLTAKNFTWT